MVEMSIYRIGLNPQGHALVILADLENTRLLPIVIGPFEAQAIAMVVRGERFERPLTHDLLTNALTALGHRLLRVEVTKLEEGTFYAVLVVQTDDEITELDARPSDAIALALRVEAPIFVSEQVLAEAQVLVSDLQTDDDESELELFKRIMGHVPPGADLPNADPDSISEDDLPSEDDK
jgi:bifunctional DNase/RNase